MPLGTFTISKDFIHGTEDGCIRVTAMPHIIMYRTPHDFAQNLTSNAELKQAGIYLLMNTEVKTLYVGQADSRDNGNGVLGRMLEPHTPEIDQWDIGYAMMGGTPTFFGATELNWLERYFYDKALEMGRYELLNSNKPHASTVTFSTETLLNNYIDFAFFLLRVEMGCDAFELPKKNVREVALFIENTKKNVRVEGVLLSGNRLLVRKGSRVSIMSNLMNQIGQEGAEKLRQQLISEGIITDYVFTRDYLFNSPSAAAKVVLGSSSSGNEKWKYADGVSLGERRKEA
ncbi:MAG: DUF4357 domain-containing protein [Synergistaceae bacterium]|nr:DUF4357 domain-containing protein [Synergistaceae bacterium]